MENINTAFIDYIREDKSKFKTATECGYYDPDNDFLVGESGGFLFNIDFVFIDTYKFSEVAINYKKNGDRYTNFEIGSPEWNKFRKREEYRRANGITLPCKLDLKTKEIKDLRITGEHYNFLNYGRMQKIDEGSIVGNTSASKKEGFPRFIDAQYWYMKAKEFALRNGFHMIVDKCRRGGFSYMEGIDSANTVNLIPKVVVVHGGYLSDYVTTGRAISVMAKQQLEFYELHTPFIRGGVDAHLKPKGLLKKDLKELKVGYKTKSGTEQGYLGSIIAISFKDNPDAAIGKDGKKIKIEELSNFPNFDAMMDVTEPTISAGSYKTGMIIAFGTGGSKEGNWVNFENAFYDPLKYDFMPFENVWDKDSRNTVCGYFKPFWQGLEGKNEAGIDAMDKDGNSNYEVAMEISDYRRKKKRESKNTSVRNYNTYCGQYANYPSESFSTSSDSIFSSVELDNHIIRLKTDPALKFYKDGMYVQKEDGVVTFKTNQELANEGHKIHNYIENVPFKTGEDVHGTVREYFTPYRVNGVTPDNLYYITADPVGIDKDTKELSSKYSLNAMYVWMYPNNIANISGDIMVAGYVGRTERMEDFSRLLLNASIRWNAKILAEVDRGQIVADFRKWHQLHRLLKDPNSILTEKLNEDIKANYGIVIGSTGRATDGIMYLKDWMYEPVSYDTDSDTKVYRFNYIYDLPFCKELQKYRKEGNYDRISAARVAAFQRMAYRVKKQKPIAKTNVYKKTTLAEIGKYYDNY